MLDKTGARRVFCASCLPFQVTGDVCGDGVTAVSAVAPATRNWTERWLVMGPGLSCEMCCRPLDGWCPGAVVCRMRLDWAFDRTLSSWLARVARRVTGKEFRYGITCD